MIRDDEACIHGATDEEREHLVALAHYEARTPGFHASFTWIFYQKPSPAGSAPVLFPVMDRWRGPYHRSGYRKRHIALEVYRDCMARFGPDKPWGRVEPIHLTEEQSDHPYIKLNPFIAEPDAVPGEEDYFHD
jgi:hypothetical protein